MWGKSLGDMSLYRGNPMIASRTHPPAFVRCLALPTVVHTTVGPSMSSDVARVTLKRCDHGISDDVADFGKISVTVTSYP
ncbi:hypothetical protein PAXRUDRAFT_831384 [Paxillus rubicundulus Ve08.2h10]|uniref:Uncharacterized protein n=1 Tax=Paxillus rubicundulus Ve08.2h10 TaxID=930991 RepID=A0A0D0DX32_9AGAM|nr:hypothetical protein PAXRUDRAFT_831384 [Paxillus rubicundulus Ve08.2h10]